MSYTNSIFLISLQKAYVVNIVYKYLREAFLMSMYTKHMFTQKGKKNIDSFLSKNMLYLIYHKYLDRQTWANSKDPDEATQNAASHQGQLIY